MEIKSIVCVNLDTSANVCFLRWKEKAKLKKENFNKIQIVQRANNGHIDIYVLEESYIYAPVYVYVYMSMSVYACVYLVARQVLARDILVENCRRRRNQPRLRAVQPTTIFAPNRKEFFSIQSTTHSGLHVQRIDAAVFL